MCISTPRAAPVDYLAGNSVITREVIARRRHGGYAAAMNATATHATSFVVPIHSVGDLLRGWRQLRRYSQLALAFDEEISPKHLSFVESGRAYPTLAVDRHWTLVAANKAVAAESR
jgi:hypothetical protein